MNRFEVGRTYTGRFISDQNATYAFKILSRTEKRIEVVDVLTKETKKVGVKNYEGNEIAYPFGRYSMAPTIKADRYQ